MIQTSIGVYRGQRHHIRERRRHPTQQRSPPNFQLHRRLIFHPHTSHLRRSGRSPPANGGYERTERSSSSRNGVPSEPDGDGDRPVEATGYHRRPKPWKLMTILS
ncbi:hypothetical protein EUGRSUZ_E01819 [Eucalyptus grandis]|uniref:Uncharacterized protein n=2 Tax=Eucalyptus grandis TaxID=71139 RepID=A0ACC3KVR1_EUCGR|nr:hypothetical protein EUGRSUZ_E01819 [Eucalyptus grandis]